MIEPPRVAQRVDPEPDVLSEWVLRQVEAGRSDINIVRHLSQKGVDDSGIRSLGELVGRSFDPELAKPYRRQPKPVTRSRLLNYSLSGAAIMAGLVSMRMGYLSNTGRGPKLSAPVTLMLAALSGAVTGALFLLLEPWRYSRRDAGTAYWLIGSVSLFVFLVPGVLLTLGEPVTLSVILILVLMSVVGGAFFGWYIRMLADRFE